MTTYCDLCSNATGVNDRNFTIGGGAICNECIDKGLHPDTPPNNEGHADFGRQILGAYNINTGSDESCLRDLLCDLMHYAHVVDNSTTREEVDYLGEDSFASALSMAKQHFTEELREDSTP
jgi:hypothetical protein